MNNINKNKLAIFGAGGFGREVLMLIQQINQINNQWDIIGFYDDGIHQGTIVNGYKVLGSVEELNKYSDEVYVVFAIGNPSIKKAIINKVNNPNVKYPIIIHPGVLAGNAEYVKIGEGSIITAGCIITINVEIGKHVILNLGCTVGHDTIIKDYCSFMPSVNISGEVKIEECVYVGTGAKIINRLQIGENVTVGAGSVVFNEIADNLTVIGNPARVIKKNN